MSIVSSPDGYRALCGKLLLLASLADHRRIWCRSMPGIQGFMGSILGQIMLLGYTWALVHHALGGLRHLIWDTGHGFSGPERKLLSTLTLVGSVILTLGLWVLGLPFDSGQARYVTRLHPFMKTPFKRVRGLGSAKCGYRAFSWRQRLTAIANIPLTVGSIRRDLRGESAKMPMQRVRCSRAAI